MSRHDPSSPDFVREEFPFYWLARLHGVYQMQMEQALKPTGLDIPTWRTLLILQQQGGAASVSEIALHAIAKLSTVTKLVYRMKAEGLVDTGTAEHDARVTMVRLAEPGRAAIERGQLAVSHIFQRSFNGLTALQIRKLNDTLHQMLDNLSPRHADLAAGRSPAPGADGD